MGLLVFSLKRGFVSFDQPKNLAPKEQIGDPLASDLELSRTA